MTPLQQLASREFFGIKLGLDTIRALTDALGQPHHQYLPVILAGTNGKGSVAAFVSQGLHAAGVRVGRYTSPHLVHVRERFSVGLRDVGDHVLERVLQRVFDAETTLRARGALPGPATYFELTTAAALVLFREARVDVAVLEVGLGGRHDATNVVAAPYAAITSIAFDHMAQLGTSLAQIAAEKAGVVSRGATVVSGVREHEAAAVIAGVCERQDARLVLAHEDLEVETVEADGRTTVTITTPARRYGPLPLALRGRHQVDNAVVAVRLLEALEAGGVGGGAGALASALSEARWPGRLELIARTRLPPLLLDGAHNPAGASALGRWLEAAGWTSVTLVVACMRDKDVTGLLAPLLPWAARVVTTTVEMPRALPAADLAAAVQALAPAMPIAIEPAPATAVAVASRAGRPVVVAGSLFLVGAVRAALAAGGELVDPA
ncbi:MAG: bifunctional folylpolyglutamate synthase/dihydrofolate synthase [Luteitalea sp.]